MITSKYYIIEQIGSDVEHHGPFDDEHSRDERASELALEHGRHAIKQGAIVLRWLSIDAAGEPLVGPYLDSEVDAWYRVGKIPKEV